MNANRMKICGTNTRIVPTPLMMPSTIIPRSGPAGIQSRTMSPSASWPCEIHADSGFAPKNRIAKTPNIIARKIAVPTIGCVSTRSIRSVNVFFRTAGRWMQPSSFSRIHE